MECVHEWRELAPAIVGFCIGSNGIRKLTVRQRLVCQKCATIQYAWSHYNEDESTRAIRPH